MGVMLQAFYWDCPRAENCEHQWWSFIKSNLPAIAQAGFTALWLPPANKAASWKSMGYDPYDYYDLGEFDQKGGVPTCGLTARGRFFPCMDLSPRLLTQRR